MIHSLELADPTVAPSPSPAVTTTTSAPSSPPSVTTTGDENWIDMGSLLTGVVAVVIALVALWVTRRQRIRAIREAAEAQRTAFELRVLLSLTDDLNNENNDVVMVPARQLGKVLILGEGVLPFWELVMTKSPSDLAVIDALRDRKISGADGRWAIYKGLAHDLHLAIDERTGRQTSHFGRRMMESITWMQR